MCRSPTYRYVCVHAVGDHVAIMTTLLVMIRHRFCSRGRKLLNTAVLYHTLSMSSLCIYECKYKHPLWCVIPSRPPSRLNHVVYPSRTDHMSIWQEIPFCPRRPAIRFSELVSNAGGRVEYAWAFGLLSSHVSHTYVMVLHSFLGETHVWHVCVKQFSVMKCSIALGLERVYGQDQWMCQRGDVVL